MRLLVVVCPNGLGHFRRVQAILERLFLKRSDLSIDILCAEWQAQRMEAHWPEPIRPHLTFHFGITDPGVRWSTDPSIYEDGRLLAWTERLEQVDLGTYDLVISDNLAQVLRRRPDAILVGSFLWSDVLEQAYPTNPNIHAFVEQENALLHAHRPPMICVGPLAMPAVLSRTRAVPCELMNYEGRLSPIRLSLDEAKSHTVAVLSGATDGAHEVHDRLILGLLEDPNRRLRMDRAAIERLGLAAHPQVQVFGFRAEDYEACAVVVARPGLGTVHDTLSAGVPLLLAYEPNLAEMSHIGTRIQTLGLGLNLGPISDAHIVGAALEKLMSAEFRRHFQEVRDGIGWNGVEQAANYLLNRLNA